MFSSKILSKYFGSLGTMASIGVQNSKQSIMVQVNLKFISFHRQLPHEAKLAPTENNIVDMVFPK